MRRTDSDEGEALLLLALSHPGRALARATAVLAGTDTGPCLASAAMQARGIVLRDRGETEEAIRELRRALVMAQRCRQVERTADVRASLGASLVMHGRTELGLAELGTAAREVHGAARATVLLRRAYVLSFLGRQDDALEDLRVAVTGFRRAGDIVWEARTLNNRAGILTALGEIGRAERDVRRAELMFAAAGQQLETVRALHNRATLAYLRGDLPRAFALYDRAEVAYTALGTRSADLVVDRCQALLAAGLTGDAVELTTRVLQGEPLQARHRAEVQLMAATSALADGDADSAAAAARRARHAFARQGRTFWMTRCELVEAQARYVAGRTVRLPALRRVAAELVSSRAEEAASALLLAGRVAAERGGNGHAELAAAARYRTSTASQVRATGWLALALDREQAGDRAGVLGAARRGLDALAGHRDVLGSTQLRALATRNTAELTTLALRHVLASGDARALLTWSERARAAALARPAVRPPQDPALAAQLAAMRAVARALDSARDRGTPTAELGARLGRLESAIDHRQRRVGAAPTGSAVAPPLSASGSRRDLARLVEVLGDRVLVEIVEVDDHLHAVVLKRGRAHRVPIGPALPALAAVQRARFALRQVARGRSAHVRDAAEHLQRSLLGEAADLLGDHPVVIVPPARLNHAPWALCPALAVRPTTSSPSAARWLVARGRAIAGAADGAEGSTATALIAGPGLAGADREVAELSAAHPGSVVLRGPDATVSAALDALGKASVVHIAAHGRHRSDNPLFSSLQLADGPLTVHDLEALPRAPGRIVLSACDSGVMAAVGSDALLGLAEALLAQGTAGVVCAVSEVNDEATRPVMTQVHQALGRGMVPAEALLAARDAARGDLLAIATAASFASLGA